MFSYDEVVKINSGFGAHQRDIEHCLEENKMLKEQLKRLEKRLDDYNFTQSEL